MVGNFLKSEQLQKKKETVNHFHNVYFEKAKNKTKKKLKEKLNVPTRSPTLGSGSGAHHSNHITILAYIPGKG